MANLFCEADQVDAALPRKHALFPGGMNEFFSRRRPLGRRVAHLPVMQPACGNPTQVLEATGPHRTDDPDRFAAAAINRKPHQSRFYALQGRNHGGYQNPGYQNPKSLSEDE